MRGNKKIKKLDLYSILAIYYRNRLYGYMNNHKIINDKT